MSCARPGAGQNIKHLFSFFFGHNRGGQPIHGRSLMHLAANFKIFVFKTSPLQPTYERVSIRRCRKSQVCEVCELFNIVPGLFGRSPSTRQQALRSAWSGTMDAEPDVHLILSHDATNGSGTNKTEIWKLEPIRTAEMA